MSLSMSMGSEDMDIQCHQQTAAVTDSCDSSTTIGIATIPYSITDSSGQQISVSYSQAGTPTSVTGGAAILAQSAASHTPPQNMAVQPSVPPSPLPHVQVIQQPLQNQYLQHLYAPQQQHMFLPGNLTIQPAIQGLAGAQGLSLQLQGKPLDNKTGGQTIISASPMQAAGNFSAPNLMSAGGQMITAGAKTCVQGQMLTASSKSTAVIQGQSTFIPSTTANQTVVIGQLGMLANQPSIIPHQAKALSDNQKNKSFLISQPATLHPKSPILPSPNVSCAGQMVASNQIKQIQSAPHIINSQAPTMIASQAQILGSLQALGASLPQGITWATPGSLHSPALFGQNPIFIRSQQSDMFIQTPPPQATIHAVPVAAAPAPQATPAPQAAPAAAPVPVAPPATASPATAVAATSTTPQAPTIAQQVAPPPPQKLKQVRPASSVATQTAVSSTSSASPQTSLTKSLAKQRPRSQQLRSSPALTGAFSVTQLQTATTQTQTNLPPSSHKADAANQTTSKITHESKILMTHNKSSSTDVRFVASEPKHEKPIIMQEVRPTMASPVVCTDIAATSTVDIPAVVTSTEREEMNMEVDESFQQNNSLPKHEDISRSKQKDTEMESVGIVAPLQETVIKDQVKQQPQKAIVKPHVLTHVIEGFVIQEGSEPFPVGRPLMQNGLSAKPPAGERNHGLNSQHPIVNDVSAMPKKKDKMPKIRGGPVELAKCEFCSKLGPKSKFKRSKRFCSTSCAKRFNIGSSKRHSSVLSESDHKSSVSGKSTKKKKLGFKKKGWRKSQSRSYELSKWVPPAEIPPVEDVNSTAIVKEKPEENVTEEISFQVSNTVTEVENIEPATVPCSQIEEPEKESPPSTLEFATKSPLKWTVTDVADFMRNLPGCSDYADEFRSQEIDGQALLLLKEDHLMSTMSMKLGPALKVCARINSLRDEINH